MAINITHFDPLGQTPEKQNGGEPFVLLFDSITFGSPAGKKEIEV